MDTLASQRPIVNQLDWTPVDVSGAGLVFTQNLQASTIRIGPLVWFYLDLTYPVTADASPAAIGGLPFLKSNGCGSVDCVASTIISRARVVGQQVNIISGTGVARTNAQLSGAQVTIGGWLGISGQISV